MVKKIKKIFNRNNIKIFAALTIFLIAGIIVWAAALPTPDLSSFSSRKIEESTKIYDRTGEIVLFDFFEDKRRRIVNSEEISRHIKNSTIAIEDRNFYEHKGIRPLAILRATFANIFSFGFSQGGSTITQQLVKNSLLTSEKKISRKFKEWVIALKIEREYTKEEILAFYFNEIPYGGNVYGIGEATEVFFGKTPSEVTIAEAAYLSALPKAPSFYSPFGPNRDELDKRKNLILSIMHELGSISEEEYEDAIKEEVRFLSSSDKTILAPHFVFFVREQLEKIFSGRDINTLGLSVTTTLDYEVQAEAEEIVRRYALENSEKFNAENAGTVVLGVESGEVLAMVGSRGYTDEEIDGAFNVTTTSRQPGSVFKPFAYATAFKKGYTPDTIIFDVETQFQEGCEPDDFEDNEEREEDDNCYSPVNYDGTFRGPITMRDALAQSVNIASIKTLYLAGIVGTFNLAKEMGLGTLTDPFFYGLTLVLGGGEVRLLDIVNAYSVFARDGKFVETVSIKNIKTRDGEDVPLPKKKQRNVLDQQTARLINDILSDNEARAPAFGERSALYFSDYSVAAKTGTTNDYRDAWIVGYSPEIAVGSWAGNNDNTPMEKEIAGFIVAPMWNEVMTTALKKHGDRSSAFVPPKTIVEEAGKPILYGSWEGGEAYVIDTVSGGLATELTPEETMERRYLYDPHTILHWVDVDNPLGPAPEDPSEVVQYELWEFGVQKWVEENLPEELLVADIPNFDDNIHTTRNRPTVTFKYPLEGSVLPKQDLAVDVSIRARFPIESYDIYFNNILVANTSQRGGRVIVPYSQIENLITKGNNKIAVSVKDNKKNSATETVLVIFK